jgi:hypothetical protein
MASGHGSTFDWNESVDKPVITGDGADLGTVAGLEDLVLIVRDGSIDRKYYRIPKDKVHDHHDGKIWLTITEEQVKSQFARLNAGYSNHEAETELKFLVKIYEETLSRKSHGENVPVLVSISNVASDLGYMTKGPDKQELFNGIIDSLSEKELVDRYAASAVAITPKGIATAKNASTTG